VLTPEDLLVRLRAAVPPPRFHMVRYFGVLSSHSAFRSRVVTESREDTTAHRPAPAHGDQLELLGEEDDRAPKALRHRWAWLLAHIFAADLERCPQCGGSMRWAEIAKTARAALRLMAKPLRSYPNCLWQFGARSRGFPSPRIHHLPHQRPRSVS